MEMSTPLRVSSTMQLPTATTQGAERHLMRQRDKQIGESIEAATTMAMSTPLRLSSTMQLPTATTHGV